MGTWDQKWSLALNPVILIWFGSVLCGGLASAPNACTIKRKVLLSILSEVVWAEVWKS